MTRGGLVGGLAEAILRIDRDDDYPVTVHAVDGGRVLLSRDADTVNPVPFGLAWPGGHAVLTSAVTRGQDQDRDRVGRTIGGVTYGSLRAGITACLNCHVFDGDPRTGRGLDFDEPVIAGELGGFPAWQVPPRGEPRQQRTWVIAVHGRGTDRREALRVLPALSAAGLTTLVVSYRNDPGAPSSRDGYCHLGEDEWRDVAAAVGYAQEQGARRLVLYGWSMGAMLALTTLRRLPREQAGLVCGLVLDSPLLDWRATLAWQARQRGIARQLARAAARQAEGRAGLSLAALDQVRYARSLTVPVLLFADTADRTVPAGPALRFARRRPHLVALITSASGHGRCWNENPVRYEAAVRAFLGARTARSGRTPYPGPPPAGRRRAARRRS